MKPKIQFSHEYFKIMGIDKRAILLNVFRTDHSKLTKEFLQYDTCYEEDGKLLYYQIPKGELLCLLFFSKNGELFTTLRSWTPEKEEYYKRMTGSWFEVVVNENYNRP